MQNNVFPDRVGVNVNVVDFPGGEYGGYNDLEEVGALPNHSSLCITFISTNERKTTGY